jgi:hypothetical protein
VTTPTGRSGTTGRSARYSSSCASVMALDVLEMVLRAVVAVALVVGHEPAPQRAVGLGLELLVDGGGDLEPEAVGLLLTEALDDLLAAISAA